MARDRGGLRAHVFAMPIVFAPPRHPHRPSRSSRGGFGPIAALLLAVILALSALPSRASVLPASPAFAAPGSLSSLEASDDAWPDDAEAPVQSESPLPESWQLPVRTPRVSSGFGRRADPFGHGVGVHRGIDFAAAVGTPVLAARRGIVVRARYQKDYGQVILIEHEGGCVTLYAHNQRLLVRRGDAVEAGQPIARVGSTGHSTGAHLHFEMRCAGERVDPRKFVAGIPGKGPGSASRSR